MKREWASKDLAVPHRRRKHWPCLTQDWLHTLQITVLLEICSFLDVKTLGTFGRTCRTLHNAASDELLWQYRLATDCVTWNMVGHLSHPHVYRTVSSNMTSKEV